MSVKIGDKIRFKPWGWAEGKDYPGVKIPADAVGTVIYVSRHLCVVEAEVDGNRFRETLSLRGGELP